MRVMYLYCGIPVIVDDEDYAYLIKTTWHLHPQGYAVGRVEIEGNKKMTLMHRYILGVTEADSRVTDHIDGNKLNNQKGNLRLCSQKVNNRNAVHCSNSTGYTGVKLRKNGRYQARININGRQVSLGMYDTAEEAGAAHKNATKALESFAMRYYHE